MGWRQTKSGWHKDKRNTKRKMPANPLGPLVDKFTEEHGWDALRKQLEIDFEKLKEEKRREDEEPDQEKGE